MTARPSHVRADAQERQERYNQLRADGASIGDAATAVGVSNDTGHRYERWRVGQRQANPADALSWTISHRQ